MRHMKAYGPLKFRHSTRLSLRCWQTFQPREQEPLTRIIILSLHVWPECVLMYAFSQLLCASWISRLQGFSALCMWPPTLSRFNMVSRHKEAEDTQLWLAGEKHGTRPNMSHCILTSLRLTCSMFNELQWASATFENLELYSCNIKLMCKYKPEETSAYKTIYSCTK